MTIKKYKYYIIMMAFLSLLLSDVKMGYLNVDKILSELDEVRQVYIELEKEQRKIEVEFVLVLPHQALLRFYQHLNILF